MNKVTDEGAIVIAQGLRHLRILYISTIWTKQDNNLLTGVGAVAIASQHPELDELWICMSLKDFRPESWNIRYRQTAGSAYTG